MKFIQTKTRHARAATVALIAVSLTPTFAYAYLDPGTGSAIIQGLIAALAAIGLALKVYWHRVLGFLGLRRPSNTDESSSDSDQSKD